MPRVGAAAGDRRHGRQARGGTAFLVGNGFVINAGPAFEQLAENDMGETAMATPAISEGTLYFRTRTRLVAIRQ
jgi:hypothetical protein